MSGGDFDIQSLAEYLHLTVQQVTRLAERGKIPGRKVAGQWRFSRPEINQWIEQRIGAADEGELAEVEAAMRPATQSELDEIRLAELLSVQAIAVPLRARTRDSVIRSMVELAVATGWLWDAETMQQAVFQREQMLPTALDNGVALLHPRRPMTSILARPLMALGISPSGIPFGGSRSGLTDVFFLICSVDDRGHLHTLARLSRVLASAGFLEALRGATTAAEAYQLVADAEARLP